MTRKKKVKPPTKFKISLSYVVWHPPPTALEKCPRCEKPHKKLKPLKLKKPMDFYDGPDGKLFARASYWAQCPKTKEPIVLFDRPDAGESILNLVTKTAVDDICKEEDAKLLSEISSVVGNTKTGTKATSGVLERRGKWVKKKGKRGQEVWVKDRTPKSRVEVKATLGPMQAWVFDPNAPERIVPGTKTKAKAQAARVKAQEKAMKGKTR
jgi:hypothetical protein